MSNDNKAKETELIILSLKNRMASMSNSERVLIIEKIKDGYCGACMTSYLPCYCWNDE